MPFHLVQIGQDANVLSANGAQDSLARLEDYVRIADEKSDLMLRFSHFVLVDTPRKPIVKGKLHIIPVTKAQLIPELWKLHRQTRITVLTTQNIWGIYWAVLAFGKALKIPVIGQIHYDFYGFQARKQYFRHPLLHSAARWFAPLYDGMRVVNQSTADLLKEDFVYGPILVLPVAMKMLGVDPDTVEPADWPGDGLKILFAGRLAPEKNLDLFVDAVTAFAKEHAASGVIIGDGPEYERIGARVAARPITMAGPLPPEKLMRWYKAADVFLLTSKHEGFGRVLAEAGHFGNILVATKSEGAKSIIKDGHNGILVADNADAIVNKLKQLVANPEMAEQLRKGAKTATAQNYDPKRQAEMYIDFLLSFSDRA
jgi:glycosyltransferase involved in cell wall biosynthesis